MVMFFNSLLRQIVGIIDGLLYGLGAELYGLMMDIASAKVFSNDTIQNVSMRVYQLLGLVMLFRLIFAFLTYVINPEDMTDKNKGYTKIVKKIFTSLALVIITPWLFTQSRNLQIYIINDHLIEYFIFGTTGSSDARPGYTLMYTVAKTFYVPYSCADADCKVKQDTKSALCTGVAWDENLPKFTEQDGKHILDTSSSAFGKCGYGADDQDYANRLWNATHPDNDGKYQLSTLTGLAPDYSGDNFKINFQWPFVGSTLVGGFICYVLLIMCMDIALRSVKLSFYEMIAPVPILSNLGFKDGKDSMLNKWFHEVLKTYADLFTRVAGLQISIFAIQELVNNGLAKNDNNIFVTLFLIIGALMFAKKLPDILKGMGINFEGGGSFNIKKKLNDEVPVLGKRINQVGSAALGLTGNAAMAAGRIAAGGVSTGATALKNKFTGKGFHSNGTFGRSLQAAQARMKASGKATGNRLLKGALLGQDVKTNVGEDAKKYRENIRTGNDNVERIGERLLSGTPAQQAQKFRAAFGNVAADLNGKRSIVKNDLNVAQQELSIAERDFKNGSISAEALAAAQKKVSDKKSMVDAIDKQMKRAIEEGPFGKRRLQEYEAYKEYKDLQS